MMVLTSGISTVMKPTISLADERPAIDLQSMVPVAFEDWREQQDTYSPVVSPQQKSILDKIYSQTLSRSYINSKGYRIMLSVAYGKNQSDALQLHKPEICYPAQGFTLLSKQSSTIELQKKSVTVVHLETKLGQRIEPISYWIVIGDRVIKDSIDRKITEMRYAVNGRIPDGILMRVSSIDQDTSKAFEMQRQFAVAMVAAIAPQNRSRFAGDPKLD